MMIESEFSQDMKAFTTREFAGEHILWAEKPSGKITIIFSFGIWLFAIPWTGFALFWEWMVAGPLILDLLGYEVGGNMPERGIKTGMWAMGLFGIPFIAVGVSMMLAPYFAYRKYQHMLVVLTNKRLAILNGKSTIGITSILPSQIISTSRKEGPDGRGTLILHEGYTKDSDGDRVEKKTEIGVINEVRRVEQLVVDMKVRASR